MKKLILGLCLLTSVAAIAGESFELSTSNASIKCGPDEEVVRILVARVCVFRDPASGMCLDWENIYKERCEPKKETN